MTKQLRLPGISLQIGECGASSGLSEILGESITTRLAHTNTQLKGSIHLLLKCTSWPATASPTCQNIATTKIPCIIPAEKISKSVAPVGLNDLSSPNSARPAEKKFHWHKMELQTMNTLIYKWRSHFVHFRLLAAFRGFLVNGQLENTGMLEQEWEHQKWCGKPYIWSRYDGHRKRREGGNKQGWRV